MSKLKVIVAAIVVAGAAAALWWRHSLNEKLRRDNEGLRRSVAELKQLREVHERAPDESLTSEQLGELSKLRSEMTRLREQTNQIGALIEANQKLAAFLKQANASEANTHKKKSAEDALPQDIHPKASWAFRGYATPEATLESSFWGEMTGDKGAILGAISPEMRPVVEKALEGRDLVEEGRKNKATGFRIADRRWLSDDEVVLTFYTERQAADGHVFYNDFSPTVFKKIGAEWKVTDRHAPDD